MDSTKPVTNAPVSATSAQDSSWKSRAMIVIIIFTIIVAVYFTTSGDQRRSALNTVKSNVTDDKIKSGASIVGNAIKSNTTDAKIKTGAGYIGTGVSWLYNKAKDLVGDVEDDIEKIHNRQYDKQYESESESDSEDDMDDVRYDDGYIDADGSDADDEDSDCMDSLTSNHVMRGLDKNTLFVESGKAIVGEDKLMMYGDGIHIRSGDYVDITGPGAIDLYSNNIFLGTSGWQLKDVKGDLCFYKNGRVKVCLDDINMTRVVETNKPAKAQEKQIVIVNQTVAPVKSEASQQSAAPVQVAVSQESQPAKLDKAITIGKKSAEEIAKIKQAKAAKDAAAEEARNAPTVDAPVVTENSVKISVGAQVENKNSGADVFVAKTFKKASAKAAEVAQTFRQRFSQTFKSW